MKLERAISALAFAAIMIPLAAHAQVVGGTDPATILTAIITWILGPIGQALAVLGLVGVGLSCIFGRLGLYHIVGYIVGIALIFGSSVIVQTFLGAGSGGGGG